MRRSLSHEEGAVKLRKSEVGSTRRSELVGVAKDV
jgi:hypothetical protein